MTSLDCLERDTQISELVGVPTLVINRPRTGRSRSSRDFTNELITFREFTSLNLALTAALGIDFPCSSFCIWLICREGLQPCFPASWRSYLLNKERSLHACLLSSPFKQKLGLKSLQDRASLAIYVELGLGLCWASPSSLCKRGYPLLNWI